MADLSLLIHLQRQEGHALGFLPTEVLTNCIERGRVYMAEENGEPAAFALFKQQGRGITIYQTAAMYDVRRRGLCLKLAEEVKKAGGRRGASVVRLACASDLDGALAFWDAAHFKRTGTAPAGKSRKGALLHLFEAPTLEQSQPELGIILPRGTGIKQGDSASERFTAAMAKHARTQTQMPFGGDVTLFKGEVIP